MSLLDSGAMAAMEALARRRDAVFDVQNPLAWFDGFWDFVTIQRSRLERAATAHVASGGGDAHAMWYVLYWYPPDEETTRLNIFVESKDGRPGIVAPWPVTTMYVHSGELVPPGEYPPRLRNEASAAALAELGFVVELGYWGTHVHRRGFSGADVEFLDRALTLALSLSVSGE